MRTKSTMAHSGLAPALLIRFGLAADPEPEPEPETEPEPATEAAKRSLRARKAWATRRRNAAARGEG